ncbi:DUF2508 family protein [Paenibacillus eucommiae]|uniref:DUF2508 family protein n=1 Tax=Paenibacillus eucommiae TaxID=1355755 RepID=A0ABS4J591_9BACL|nr:DUF2508 family protein [Paenibacillus eucommiae]MBP1994980.1 hypothetical protein [Paenibacillus eucommiae]
MKLSRNWFHVKWGLSARQQAEDAARERELLLLEIQKALKTWVHAQAQFEYALDKDEIDYAIYSLEAAEKRYEMLLRKAKNTLVNSDGILEVEPWSSPM